LKRWSMMHSRLTGKRENPILRNISSITMATSLRNGWNQSAATSTKACTERRSRETFFNFMRNPGNIEQRGEGTGISQACIGYSNPQNFYESETTEEAE